MTFSKWKVLDYGEPSGETDKEILKRLHFPSKYLILRHVIYELEWNLNKRNITWRTADITDVPDKYKRSKEFQPIIEKEVIVLIM